jgi:hypothetical protein
MLFREIIRKDDFLFVFEGHSVLSQDLVLNEFVACSVAVTVELLFMETK